MGIGKKVLVFDYCMQGIVKVRALQPQKKCQGLRMVSGLFLNDQIELITNIPFDN